MSCQLHALATLISEKQSTIPNNWEAAWVQKLRKHGSQNARDARTESARVRQTWPRRICSLNYVLASFFRNKPETRINSGDLTANTRTLFTNEIPFN